MLDRFRSLARPQLLLVGIAALAIAYLTIIPLAMLLYGSVKSGPPGVTGELTLRNYMALFDNWRLGSALFNSLVFSAGSSFLAFSGVAATVDPLGGSYFVEALTSALEEKALAYRDAIEGMGGASRAIEYMQEEVHRAAYQHQLAVESEDRIVVGVNRYADAAEKVEIPQPDYGALEREQQARLAAVRERRDPRHFTRDRRTQRQQNPVAESSHCPNPRARSACGRGRPH